jgi:hypothetical protein
MSTKARVGVGTKFKLGDGASPENFTAIAEIRTIKFSGTKVTLVKVTNMDSPASSTGLIYEEYIAGTADGGSCDFTADFLPGDATQLAYSAAIDGKAHDFQILLPLNPASSPVVTFGHYSFQGIIQEDAKDFPVDKEMSLTGKIQITGPVFFTANA